MKIPFQRSTFLPWLVGAGCCVLGPVLHAAAQTGSASESQSPQQTLDAATKASGLPVVAGGRHLAPHDTFFLLSYASAKTASGVIGFEPGRKVHLVEVHPATQTLLVGDDEAQVEVGPEKLTNDLDIAALVRQKDEANQAKIAAYVQAEQDAHAKFVKEAADATAKDIEDRKEERKERVAEAQAAEQSKNDRPNAQSSYASNAGVGGYYDDGGYGYGSPFAYFVNNSSPGTPNSAPAAPAKPGPNNTATPAKPAAPSRPAPAVGAPPAAPAAPAAAAPGKAK